MRVLAALVLACMATAVRAQEAPIDWGRQGLAWSIEEVSRANRPSVQRALDDARRRDQLGCQRHCEMIGSAWDRLLRSLPSTPYTERLRLHVIQTPSEDAFASPGGEIVLSEAMIERDGLGEAQVAFVLAHEISHVMLQHDRQTLALARALRPSLARAAVGEVYDAIASSFTLQKLLRASWHEAEYESDQLGMQLAAFAGYEPRLQLDYLRGLARQPAVQDFMQTHPGAAERLARAREGLAVARRFLQRSAVVVGGPP